MKTLHYLLCLVLALSLVGLGCPKEEGAAPEEAAKEEGQAEPAKEEAKEEPAKEEAAAEAPAEPAVKLDPAVEKFIDERIAAMGGADKLKPTGWTSKSKGTYAGKPYTSSNTGMPGVTRMDIEMPGGAKMPMVHGLDKCWSQTGPVVIPCTEEAAKHARIMTAMIGAQMLMPLKTQAGWELAVDGDTLKVKHAEYGVDGSLTFDPESKLITGMTYKSTVHGQAGEFVTKYSDHKEFCGIQFPAKMVTALNKKPWLTEEWLEMTCGDVDESLFEQPEQVADGTFVEKTTPPMAVACMKHKGPHEKLNDGVAKLMKLMMKQKLAPAGPVMMTFLKGPPKVKKAKKFVTEICVPVMVKKPPKRPKKKGKLTLKGMKPQNVLAVYGSGDYQTKTGELMKALKAEVKKRKLKAKGPACGVYYMDSSKVPPEQQVAEVMIAVKGGKKKPKKAPKPKLQKKKVIKPIKKNP